MGRMAALGTVHDLICAFTSGCEANSWKFEWKWLFWTGTSVWMLISCFARGMWRVETFPPWGGVIVDWAIDAPPWSAYRYSHPKKVEFLLALYLSPENCLKNPVGRIRSTVRSNVRGVSDPKVFPTRSLTHRRIKGNDAPKYRRRSTPERN